MGENCREQKKKEKLRDEYLGRVIRGEWNSTHINHADSAQMSLRRRNEVAPQRNGDDGGERGRIAGALLTVLVFDF